MSWSFLENYWQLLCKEKMLAVFEDANFKFFSKVSLYLQSKSCFQRTFYSTDQCFCGWQLVLTAQQWSPSWRCGHHRPCPKTQSWRRTLSTVQAASSAATTASHRGPGSQSSPSFRGTTQHNLMLMLRPPSHQDPQVRVITLLLLLLFRRHSFICGKQFQVATVDVDV